jgi:hypothetical protein
VESPFQPLKGSNAETAGAVARGSKKIGSRNQHMNISLATTSRQSLSLHPSETEIAPNLSDEEKIGAWIYKCSNFARRNVTTAGAIAGGSGKIGACCNPQTNISHANGCQLPSILSSATTSDLPDEDDIIGAKSR